jgi:hypothetical protein
MPERKRQPTDLGNLGMLDLANFFVKNPGSQALSVVENEEMVTVRSYEPDNKNKAEQRYQRVREALLTDIAELGGKVDHTWTDDLIVKTVADLLGLQQASAQFLGEHDNLAGEQLARDLIVILRAVGRQESLPIANNLDKIYGLIHAALFSED